MRIRRVRPRVPETLSRGAIRAVTLLAALAVAGTAAFVAFRPEHVTHVTAHFTRAVGVYAGSDVRVLGVKVGRITHVHPEGATVRVDMVYDRDRRVPADAVAVIVPPSLVSDRYVQLAPVYRGGPVLRDHADIPVSRTTSPVELDDVYQSLNNLSVALGPQGANRDGALSRLLSVGADNLRGNGGRINSSIGDLDRAVTTLTNGRDDLFGSVRNLQKFVSALSAADQQVRTFDGTLATVAQQLADERVSLGAALKNLAAALKQITTFVRGNQALLKSNISGLARITGTLVTQRAALAEFLDVAPTALSNLGNAYDPASGTLDTRNNFNQLTDPAFVCALLMSLPAVGAVAAQVARCRQAASLDRTFSGALTSALRSLGVPLSAPSTPAATGSGSTDGSAPSGGSGAPGDGTGQDLPTVPGAGGDGGDGGAGSGSGGGGGQGGLPSVPGTGGDAPPGGGPPGSGGLLGTLLGGGS